MSQNNILFKFCDTRTVIREEKQREDKSREYDNLQKKAKSTKSHS